MPKRLTYKDVKQYFEDHDCELFEKEYKNNYTPMRYRCVCGNKECKINFNKFKEGQRCPECRGGIKLTFDFVKQYFEDHDCNLLGTEYINALTLMKYRCDCGNSDCKISFANFSRGKRCMECSGKKKHTLKEVKKYFEEHDCKLLATEYINNSTPMEYECVCGNDEGKINFSNFKNGRRCKKCVIERTSGKNHWSYNPNLTDEEKRKNNPRPGGNKWRKLILERDNFTCQCCFQEERKLIAHHIEDYKHNKELRTVVSNGFLFCNKHHKEFHTKYGNNCNREQLNEFLKNIK